MEKFLREIATNSDLREKIKKCKDAKELYEISKPHLGKMGYENFLLELQSIASAIRPRKDELSEDDLGSISGGIKFDFVDSSGKSTGSFTTSALIAMAKEGKPIPPIR